jgi:hypothetical protein
LRVPASKQIGRLSQLAVVQGGDARVEGFEELRLFL